MSEALWIVVIVNLLAVLSVWIKAFFDYKAKKAMAKRDKVNSKQNKPNNPNQIPGGSTTCIRNGNKIAKLCTQYDFIQKQIDDLKTDMEKNFDTVYAELRKK